MKKVGGAIQRINDPLIGAFFRTRDTGFFSQNLMRWIGFAQNLNDRTLTGHVHFAHIIVMRFFVHFKAG